jgi:hypothetical protein
MLVWYVNYSQSNNNMSSHPGVGRAVPVDANATAARWSDGSIVRNRTQPWDATFKAPGEYYRPLHLQREVSDGQGGTQLVTLDVAKRGAKYRFDDTDPNAYYDPENPQGSVKVAGSGTSIEVKSYNPANQRMTVRVAPSSSSDLPTPNSGRPAVDTSQFVTTGLRMVDDQALPQTQSLFAYLKNLGDSGHTLFGHEADTMGVVNNEASAKPGTWDGIASDTRRATGQFPGVYGATFTWGVDEIKTAYRRGQIVTISDHTSNLSLVCPPFPEDGWWECWGYGNTKNPLNPVEQILPGGPKHAQLVNYLDTVALRASEMVDDNGDLIPVIYRPWHEHNGDWFWWNTSNATEGELAELFRYTVHYLRDVKGVRNFLYAFSPNGHFENLEEYLYGYPGDDYIDVLGFDTYYDVPVNNPDWYSQTLNEMRIIAQYAQDTGKVAAMTETGVRYDAGSHGFHVTDHYRYPLDWWTQMGQMIRNDPLASKLAYWLVWVNYSTTQFWVPFKDHATYGTHPMVADFINMYNMDSMVFADRVGDYTHLVASDAVNTVPVAPGVRIHTPEFKDYTSGTVTAYVEANERWAPCLASSTPDVPAKTRAVPIDVSVQLGGDAQPWVDATLQSGTNGWWTASLDTTGLPDGRLPIKARATYGLGPNSGVCTSVATTVVTDQHDVFVQNTPPQVNPDPYLIDDFESYDATEDNRTDVERVWWRDSGVMNALRLRYSQPTYYSDPQHWLNKAWSDKSLDTGQVLRVKYDVVDKDGTTDWTTQFSRTFPAPYRDWSAARSFSVRVQPDGKEHLLKFRITTGTGNANTFDCDFSTTGVNYGWQPKLVAPQLITVPIGCFKALQGGVEPTAAQLAGVRTFAVRITENREKGHLGGLNALEYYLFDDLKVSTTPADSAANLAALRVLVQVYSLYENSQDTYTASSYLPMAEALRLARAQIDLGVVSDLVLTQRRTAFEAAAAGLVLAVDTSGLQYLIGQAELVLANRDQYVSSQLAALSLAVDAAKALLLSDGLTQDQVTAGISALADALAKVHLKGDKSILSALIQVVDSLHSEQFTPASWAPVAQALAAARLVEADADASVYQVDQAVEALTAALDDLVLRAAKAGLASVVSIAEAIVRDRNLYVPSSLVGLDDALAQARTVLADDDATQAAVSAAQSALLAKIAAAKLRNTGSPAPLLPANQVEQLSQTVDSAPAVTAKAVKVFTKAAKPKVRGSARVGQLLKAKTGAWTAQPKLSYQWYRSGKAIKAATGATYKVTKADLGKRLQVKVKASKPGYQTKTKTSTKTKPVTK